MKPKPELVGAVLVKGLGIYSRDYKIVSKAAWLMLASPCLWTKLTLKSPFVKLSVYETAIDLNCCLSKRWMGL